MSFKALSWAWEANTITAGRKLVLVGLAQFANEKNECWPSQKTLAERTMQSERTVREHLAWLEAEEFISRQSRTTDTRFDSDVIRLHIDRIEPANNKQKPAADFAAGKEGASGEKPQEPAADFAGSQRQISPPNLHMNLQQESPITPLPPKGGLEPVRRKKSTEEDHDHLIPLQLQTPEFIAAWHTWAGVRIKARQAMSEEAAKRQLHRLATEAGTPEEAIRWLDNAIERGWRAPFNPGAAGGHRQGAAPTRRASDTDYARNNAPLSF